MGQIYFQFIDQSLKILKILICDRKTVQVGALVKSMHQRVDDAHVYFISYPTLYSDGFSGKFILISNTINFERRFYVTKTGKQINELSLSKFSLHIQDSTFKILLLASRKQATIIILRFYQINHGI